MQTRLTSKILVTWQLHKILAEKKSDDPRKLRNKNLPVEEGCLSKGSVIVYVWRQKDTEIVAEQLNGAGVSGGVVCYHGGMDSNDRARAQSSVSNLLCSIRIKIQYIHALTLILIFCRFILFKFLRGKARICVATVGKCSFIISVFRYRRQDGSIDTNLF